MDITIPYGDDKSFKITVTANGAAKNMTGWKVYFTVKRSTDAPDSKKITSLSKLVDFTGVSDDAVGGIGYLSFSSDDTKVSPGTYYYNMRIVDAAGKKQSTSVGTLTIEAVVDQDSA